MAVLITDGTRKLLSLIIFMSMLLEADGSLCFHRCGRAVGVVGGKGH